MKTTHEFLTEDGMYVHTHYDEEFEDRGGPESGPLVDYSPAYDEYAGESHYLIVEGGVIVHTIPRNIRYEEEFDDYFGKMTGEQT